MIRPRLRAIIVLAGLAGPCAAQAPDPPVPADRTSGAPATPSAPDSSGGSDDPSTPAARAKLAVARPPYPRAVERALARGRRSCRAVGGAVVYPPGVVRTGDLTGDGRPDFVVDFREAECPGAPGLYEGTGGWDIEILASRPRGGPVTVFAGRVGSYDVSDGPGARTMTFDVHGSYCGRAGADPCVKRRRIDGRRFTVRGR